MAPVWRPAGSRPKNSWWYSLNMKEEEKQCPNSNTVRQEESLWTEGGSAFFFYLGLQSMCWCPPTLGRQSALPSLPILPIQLIILCRNTLMGTRSIIFGQMSGHPMAKSSWHIKIITTLSQGVSGFFFFFLSIWILILVLRSLSQRHDYPGEEAGTEVVCARHQIVLLLSIILMI